MKQFSKVVEILKHFQILQMYLNFWQGTVLLHREFLNEPNRIAKYVRDVTYVGGKGILLFANRTWLLLTD